MAKLFLSYSHKDEALRQELEVHLAILRRQGLIEVWHDRRILAGDAIDDTISQHLEDADIVLLLVSPDFLASDYCYAREMTRALERHKAGEARAISVILRQCDWKHTPLSKFMVTPTDGKPITKFPDKDDAMQDVVSAIRAAIQSRGGPAGLPKAPAPTSVLSTTGAAVDRPRSSNLRIRQEFTDRDRHVFLEQAYEFVANFFEGSLEELKARHSGIDTSFRRIDANHFSAAIFRDGKQMASCRIWLGGIGRSQGNILFSHDASGRDSAWNESISVEADSQSLYLKSMGMSSHMRTAQDSKMTSEGAAEMFWAMFIHRLQD